jgi:hypothetical protein
MDFLCYMMMLGHVLLAQMHVQIHSGVHESLGKARPIQATISISNTQAKENVSVER